jgi:hypothetical protein
MMNLMCSCAPWSEANTTCTTKLNFALRYISYAIFGAVNFHSYLIMTNKRLKILICLCTRIMTLSQTSGIYEEGAANCGTCKSNTLPLFMARVSFRPGFATKHYMHFLLIRAACPAYLTILNRIAVLIPSKVYKLGSCSGGL